MRSSGSARCWGLVMCLAGVLHLAAGDVVSAAGIPVTCNQGGGELVLKNEQDILNQCGARLPVRQQVECMRQVTVQTSGCNVTFMPQLEQGTVCPGFPCQALTWKGVSIGGQVQVVHLTVNVADICAFLTNLNNALACKDMLVLCAAGSSAGKGGGSSSGSAPSNASVKLATTAAAVDVFRCDADSTFAVPDQRGGRINLTSLVVSVVLGSALLVVVVATAVCLCRRWRTRRRERAAALSPTTFELGASMFGGSTLGNGAPGAYAGREGLMHGGDGVVIGVPDGTGDDCCRGSTPDGVVGWGHGGRRSASPSVQKKL